MSPSSSPTLTISLPSDREIMIERVLNAPRPLVFEAYTTCEHMRQWWGPAKYKFRECDIDFRVGGKWRIVQAEDGAAVSHGFHGEYLEIVPNERIVQTFEYEGMPGHVSTETLTLTELGSQTKVTIVARFETAEDRDGMLESGMESGAAGELRPDDRVPGAAGG